MKEINIAFLLNHLHSIIPSNLLKRFNLSGINNNISVIKNEEKDDRDLMSSRLHDLYTNIPVNNYKYTPDLSNLISDMVSPRRNEKEDDLRKKETIDQILE